MTEIVYRSDMSVELVASSANDLRVVQAARVSTMAANSNNDTAQPEPGSAEDKLIRYLMRSRHGSPFEHAMLTFLIQAPIFVWREFMRHRIASYNEESARYRQLAPVFYVPGEDRALCQTGKAAHPTYVAGTAEQAQLVQTGIRRTARIAYGTYETLLSVGVAREVARMVLPLSIYSSAYVSMNPRALMNFLSLRTERADAHFPSAPMREIAMVAEQMETCWKALMPLTHQAFDDCGRVAP